MPRLAEAFTPGEDPEMVRALLESVRQGNLCMPWPTPPTSAQSLVWDKGWLYLRRLWEWERGIVSHVRRLLGRVVPQGFVNKESSDLLPAQQRAVQQVCCQGLTLVCGGPGTGKTYTIQHLAKGVSRVIFAAPTGKAAANMQEGVTLHALLQLRQGRPPPPPRPLHADLVVVDEASMIDVGVMHQLLASIGPKTRLVLMGDPDQLPPVASGAVFADLVAALPDQVAWLTACMRTDRHELLRLAEGVRNGVYDGPIQPISEFQPYTLYPEFRLLTPLQRGPYGVEAINASLERRHQGASRIPIMITQNCARYALYNGDTGWLCGDRAQIGGRQIPKWHLPKYVPAYALSIHKSQGSEYERVAIVLPHGSERFGRSLLYTAITRARHEVRLFADPTTIEQVVAAAQSRCSRIPSSLVTSLRTL